MTTLSSSSTVGVRKKNDAPCAKERCSLCLFHALYLSRFPCAIKIAQGSEQDRAAEGQRVTSGWTPASKEMFGFRNR